MVFAHLFIVEDPDHHQNLIITCTSLSHPRRIHKISLQFIHNFLSNFVYKQTDGQTDISRKNNSTKNIRRIGRSQISLTNASDYSPNIINLLAKEVMNVEPWW